MRKNSGITTKLYSISCLFHLCGVYKIVFNNILIK